MMEESSNKNLENTGGDETVMYAQDDVYTSPSTPDELSVAGKLKILYRRNGIVVEWRCNEDEISGDNDWALINPAAVYHNNSSDAVEISSAKRNIRPIVVELIDLRSYKLLQDKVLILIQRDGTTHPALRFSTGNPDDFVQVLLRYVAVKKSDKDSTLFLIHDKYQVSLDTELTNMNLVPERRWHRHHGAFDISHAPQKVFGFFNNMRKDPYTTALSTLSKFNEFLLYSDEGAYSPITSEQEEVADLFKSLNSSEELEPGFDLITKKGTLAKRPVVERLGSLTRDEFKEFCDSEGRITDIKSLKEKIFRGGIHPNLRAELWCYLLGHYDWDSTYNEREQQRKKLEDEYFIMKRQWMTISSTQENNFTGLRDRRSLIEKDVNRTDRTHPFYEKEDNTNVALLHDILMTYIMYNFDLGYVQGMSDLLSPILYVTQNEASAFWCFVGFMKLVYRNFDIDQSGMKKQLKDLHLLMSVIDPEFKSYLEVRESVNLYFCFRWLLVWFKRELSYVDTLRLWEVLWTAQPCPNFHLLVASAILDTEKNTIIENKFGFTEILKHINDISMRIDLELTLKKAEGIYLQLKSSSSVPDNVLEIVGLPPNKSPEKEFESPVEEADVVSISSESSAATEGLMNVVTSMLDSAVKHLSGEDLANLKDSDERESKFEDAISYNYM